MIFLLWLGLAVGVGAWARSLNRSFGGFFFLALVLSPVIGAIVLLVSGSAGKNCPKCAEKIKAEAKLCKHCGHDFETRAAETTQKSKTGDDWLDKIGNM